MEIIRIVVIVLIACSFCMSACDILPKRYWLRRVFTVSKLHQWMTTVICLVMYVILFMEEGGFDLLPIGMGVFVLINNGMSLWKYLPFYPSTIASGEREDIRILALNVRQKNTDHQGTLEVIEKSKADIVALTETDEVWAEKLSVLDAEFPYRIKIPLNNTYGMILLSQLEIVGSEIKYLVSDEVPSIHADLLFEGEKFHLMFIHPEPPLDFRRLKEKDLEILKVSYRADEADTPVILCGDLNDVGWSYASRHMCEQSELEDPRIGRGFFNTYNAHIPIFRYPIDHFFLSPSFKVVGMNVLEKCGSDHFPVLMSLEFPAKKRDGHATPLNSQSAADQAT